MKIPNLSACAGSSGDTVTHVKIEHATDANDARKHKFDKFLLLLILPPIVCNKSRVFQQQFNVFYQNYCGKARKKVRPKHFNIFSCFATNQMLHCQQILQQQE
tara:strand:- start:460 stop:768 length:309 start_codon:yes stop_codon:yes gene_type:complete